jgi:NHS family xanthosine MFS transporter
MEIIIYDLNTPKYADSFVLKYSTIIMSISQISETLFILAIPFFLTIWD